MSSKEELELAASYPKYVGLLLWQGECRYKTKEQLNPRSAVGLLTVWYPWRLTGL